MVPARVVSWGIPRSQTQMAMQARKATTTNWCSHHPQHPRTHVSVARDESSLVAPVRVRLRRWVPSPTVPRSRTKTQSSASHLVQAKPPARDVHAHVPGYNTLPTKTTHVPVPVHYTRTATRYSQRTHTTRCVSRVEVVVFVKAEPGLDQTSQSHSTRVSVGVAMTMKSCRSIRHSHPFQARWR